MIKGVSDQLRLPRRGKIRLGEKKVSEKTGKEYPSALDFFVCPEEVKEIYGEQPRQLDIMIPMEDTESFFPQYFKRYGSSSGLVCRGDGESATLMLEEGMKEIECQGQECQYYQDKQCRRVGNLQVILPKVKGLGVYQIDTSSRNSIVNLNSGLKMIRGMLGRISWIPLVLEVKMQEAHPTVNGKRIKTIVPVMSITSDVSVYDLLKMRLSGKQAVIDNPDIDDKPGLLFPDLEKKGSIATAKESEKKDKQTVNDIGETEVKDEPKGKILSEKEAQKEQDKLLEKGEPESKQGRNQLNIRWHVLKKKLFEVGYFADEESYRGWLEEEFGEDKQSLKDLDKNNMIWGIEVMAKKYNEHSKGN